MIKSLNLGNKMKTEGLIGTIHLIYHPNDRRSYKFYYFFCQPGWLILHEKMYCR